MMELSELAKSEMRRLSGTHWSFVPLPDELFEQMSSNPELRNAIAGAKEQWRELDCKHVAWIAQVYPRRYAVSPEQIQAAKDQWAADKQAMIERLTGTGTLLMIDMGSMEHKPADPDDIPSYRLRGQFQIPNGRRFMLEVSLSNKENTGTGPMYCSEFVDLDLEEQGAAKPKGKDYRWIKDADLGAYTMSNLLNLVNRQFGCHFKSLEIDHDTLYAKDYTSVSP